MFGVGPAGTGKTYLAMAQAVSYLLAKKVSRIILARPAVEAGEKLGFLPGDLQEKVNPYLRPLYDALYDMLDVEKAERLLERGAIEVAPLAFMRGRTLNDAFVILDEAQNTTVRADEDVPDAPRLRIEGGGHRRRHADRPADRTQSGLVEAMQVVRSRGHRVRLLRRARRRAPQARAAIVKAYEALRAAASRASAARRQPSHGAPVADAARRVDVGDRGPAPARRARVDGWPAWRRPRRGAM